MHIPDGFLDISVSIITYLIAVVFLLFAIRKTKAILNEKQIPLMATLTAVFFAAQMMNYPIIGGTTAHILGGPALAIVLGPYAGMISMTIILLIQALLFGDGGIITLGANVFNMGIIGVFIPFFIFITSIKFIKSRNGLILGAFLGGLIGNLLSAIFAGLELGLSTLSFPYSIEIAVTAMAIHHFFIGIGEGIITVFLITIILKQRPDLLEFSEIIPKNLHLPFVSKDSEES